MKRNVNVEIIRCFALFIMLIYHFWVKTGSPTITNEVFATFVMLGGEIGVTGFFLLSGYGVWCSLYNLDKTNDLTFSTHMKKRINRIAPQYYLCLLVVLLFTYSSAYVSKEHIINIFTHLLFVHNITGNFSGAINGVLWTMAVIFQFYIVAILLYKGLKKINIFFCLAIILLTVFVKKFSYTLLFELVGDDFTRFTFWVGRQQLINVLDNFVIGMTVAKVVTEKKGDFKRILYVIGSFVSIIMIYVVCKIGLTNGIHTNNLSGYIWHSLLAVAIGTLTFFVANMQSIRNLIIVKIISFFSRCEYGIYLWHLVMIDNLLANSPLVRNAMEKQNIMFVWLCFLIASVLVGYVFTKLTEKIKIFHGK